MNKKKGQKYQNKEEYTLKYQPLLAKLKDDTPKDNLCNRCFEQIDWKLKFGKYKKLTEPRRCQICEFKRVVKAYRHICDSCVKEKGVCSKCGTVAHLKTELPKVLESLVEHRRFQDMENLLKTLRECSRRKIMRLIHEDQVMFKDGKFVHKEGGALVEGLQVKKKYRLGKHTNEDGEEDGEDDEDSRDFDDDEMAYLDEFIKNHPKMAQPIQKEDMKDKSGSLDHEGDSENDLEDDA
jgi:hypothetical protein